MLKDFVKSVIRAITSKYLAKNVEINHFNKLFYQRETFKNSLLNSEKLHIKWSHSFKLKH